MMNSNMRPRKQRAVSIDASVTGFGGPFSLCDGHKKIAYAMGQAMSLGGHIASEQLYPAAPGLKSIFGVAVSDLSREEAIGRLLQAVQYRQPMKIAFCNAHTANLAWNDSAIRALLGDFTVFADGVGIDIAARLLHGHSFAANLNGTDFVPSLLVAEARPLRIALFGARPGVADKAAAILADIAPQHQITAVRHGYASETETDTFLTELRANPVDILLVAMGNPHQEQWIARNITGDHATLAFGVGALFDFLAGEVPRAPLWIRQIRLEWLYRLGQEPGRLFARYVLGIPLFLLRVALVKLGLFRFNTSNQGLDAA
jgi:exopolysaccharide biosynthesis WecB/TagA/CpsF family protein